LENFGRVSLVFEVNGREIVVGLFIGKENRGTFGQKRVTIWFCNGQKFEIPFSKIFLPKNRVTFGLTCHDLTMSKVHQI